MSRRRASRGRGAPAPVRQATLAIERLGSGGEGVGLLDGRPVFVPFTLPGETWHVEVQEGGTWRGRPLECSGPPAPRAEPVCPHFTRCGGCLLQHLPDDDYVAFKRQRVLEPLSRAGLTLPAPAPLSRSPLGSRRRVRLAYARRGAELLLGYRGLRSHRVVSVETCPIARPSIQRLLTPLRNLLAALSSDSREGEIAITDTVTGLDVRLGGIGAAELAARERLAAFANEMGLARLTVEPAGGMAEAVVTHQRPVLRLGRTDVPLPPASFLQATREGEAALRAAVADWLPDNLRVVDLFAGLGTLTLPLAARLARLDLVEGDADASAACAGAVAGQARVRAFRRDLDADPLDAQELAKYDVAVLDPPRAGAARQVEKLAASPLERLIYVSCHPGSFARDAQILEAAGFKLAALRPVDQFLYAPEVELAGLFLRGAAASHAVAALAP